MDALERIEVALRVDISYLLGEKDAYAYRNSTQLHTTFAGRINKMTGNSTHQDWLNRYDKQFKRSKEDFVKHNRQKYGGDLPIWIASEIWDFGTTSQLLSMMKVPDQAMIAKKYGVQDFRVFASWLRALTYFA